jgi:hypothetical protein
MYAQEYSFYRRPDTSNVTWFTPQQLEAARVSLTLAPVKVREIPPKIRSSPDENVDTQGLLAAAPALLAKALRKGLAVIRKENPADVKPLDGKRGEVKKLTNAEIMRQRRPKFLADGLTSLGTIRKRSPNGQRKTPTLN